MERERERDNMIALVGLRGLLEAGERKRMLESENTKTLHLCMKTV
jgi:hypothetical protein